MRTSGLVEASAIDSKLCGSDRKCATESSKSLGSETPSRTAESKLRAAWRRQCDAPMRRVAGQAPQHHLDRAARPGRAHLRHPRPARPRDRPSAAALSAGVARQERRHSKALLARRSTRPRAPSCPGDRTSDRSLASRFSLSPGRRPSSSRSESWSLEHARSRSARAPTTYGNTCKS